MTQYRLTNQRPESELLICFSKEIKSSLQINREEIFMSKSCIKQIGQKPYLTKTIKTRMKRENRFRHTSPSFLHRLDVFNLTSVCLRERTKKKLHVIILNTCGFIQSERDKKMVKIKKKNIKMDKQKIDRKKYTTQMNHWMLCIRY